MCARLHRLLKQPYTVTLDEFTVVNNDDGHDHPRHANTQGIEPEGPNNSRGYVCFSETNWFPGEQREALRRDGREPCRLRDDTCRISAIRMTSGVSAQKARHRCRSSTPSRQTDPWNSARSTPSSVSLGTLDIRQLSGARVARHSDFEDTPSTADTNKPIRLKVLRKTPKAGRAQEKANDERGRAAGQDGSQQDSGSNRARQCNLPGRLQGGCCGNESQGGQATATEN